MKSRNTILALLLIGIGAALLIFSMKQKPAASARKSFEGAVESQKGANVLLITLDTTRADHIGCYGGRKGVSPNIDSRIAARGLRFLRASAVAPITLPSHTSMLTGLDPIHHGVRSNGTFALDEKFQTLAGSFHDAGYRTAAFISAEVLSRRYGLGRHFDFYDDDLSRVIQHTGVLVPSRSGNFTVDSVLDWMRQEPKDTPFFCWVHLYDPHAPLTPPPDFARKFPGDPYSAEIAFADFQIGRLLDELEKENLIDSTYLSVIADHGEAFGAHGESSHGVLVHEATIHIPWIIAGPGIPHSKVINTTVSNVDVAPTLARLAGVEPPNTQSKDGVNVLSKPWLDPKKEHLILVESLLPRYQYGWAPLYALRKGDWKLVSGSREELFNLQEDPKELRDLSLQKRDIATDLGEKLKSIIENSSGHESRIQLSAGERDQLAALGYLGSESSERKNPPDPRDLIGAQNQLEEALNLVAAGRNEEAICAFDRGLAVDPDNVLMLVHKARVLRLQHKDSEARESLKKALALAPDNADAYEVLAQIELSQKNYSKALELAELGQGTSGAFENFTVLKSAALMGLGRSKEARELIRQHLEKAPDDSVLLSERARQLLAEGHRDQAEKLLRHALDVDALSARARFQLADLLLREGRKQEAVTVLKDLLKSEPTNARALATLGKIQMTTDPASSIPYLEEAVRAAPEDPKKLTALGVAYIQANRVPDAEAVLRKATGLAPENPEIRNNLAILLIRQGKLNEAIEQLETILNAHSDFVPARNNLAIALIRSGKLDRAEQEAKRAIREQPDFVDAKMTLASLYHRQKKWAGEYQILHNLKPKMKQRADIRDTLAEAAYRTGHCRETLSLLNPLISSRQQLPWNLELAVASCLEKEGRSREALLHFEEAARLSPPGPGRREAQEGVKRISLGDS